MQINRKANKKTAKRLFAFLSIVIILFAVGYGVFAYTQNKWPFEQTADQNSSTLKDEDSEETIDKTDNNPSQKDSLRNTDSNDKNSSSGSVDASITSITQNKNSLKIQTNINTISDNGKCVLTLSKGNETIERESGIVSLVQSSMCDGFEVSTKNMSSGKWSINIEITLPENKTARLTDTVIIE